MDMMLAVVVHSEVAVWLSLMVALLQRACCRHCAGHKPGMPSAVCDKHSISCEVSHAAQHAAKA